MSQKLNAAIAVIGIDIGKNSFQIVGHNHRGAIVLRQRWSRGKVETRLAYLPPCLIGMEACAGALCEGTWWTTSPSAPTLPGTFLPRFSSTPGASPSG